MKTILFVDDETEFLELYAMMLERKGYNVITAKDGEEASSIYKKLNPKPDVILMDYRMPVKDGITAAREILTENNANIIFTSADETILPLVEKMGMSFLRKPFSLETLEEKIESLH